MGHQLVLFFDQRYATGQPAAALHLLEHLVENHEAGFCSEPVDEMESFVSCMCGAIPISSVISGLGSSCERTMMFQK